MTAKRNAERELAIREINNRKRSGFWDYKVKDLVEPALVMGSSIVAEPISGLAGLSALPFGVDAASGTIEGVRDALTYEPRLQKTRDDLGALSHAVEPISDAIQDLSQVPGDFVFDKTGSPELATLAYSAIPAAAELLGLKGASRLGGRKFEFGDIGGQGSSVGGKQRGIFAGVKAKNADLDQHSKAVLLDESGATRDEIWNETGWFKGADGGWRFEIDDSTSSLNMMHFPEEGEGSITTELSNFLKHPRIYESYPEAKDLTVLTKSEPGSGTGSLMGGMDGFMTVRGGGDNARSTVLHETQHAIQRQEGFSKGGGPDQFSAEYDKNLANKKYYDGEASAARQAARKTPEYIAYHNELLKALETKDMAKVAEIMPKRRKIEDAAARPFELESAVLSEKIKFTPHESYERLGGEVEARNTQKRLNMTAKERRETPPWKTQDFEESEQILLPSKR